MGMLGRNCIAKGGTDIGSQEVNPKPLVHTEESWERPFKKKKILEMLVIRTCKTAVNLNACKYNQNAANLNSFQRFETDFLSFFPF